MRQVGRAHNASETLLRAEHGLAMYNVKVRFDYVREPPSRAVLTFCSTKTFLIFE